MATRESFVIERRIHRTIMKQQRLFLSRFDTSVDVGVWERDGKGQALLLLLHILDEYL